MVAINIVVTANNLITVDTAVAMVKAVYTTIAVLEAAANRQDERRRARPGEAAEAEAALRRIADLRSALQTDH